MTDLRTNVTITYPISKTGKYQPSLRNMLATLSLKTFKKSDDDELSKILSSQWRELQTS